MASQGAVKWTALELSSPTLQAPVLCIAALDIPYVENAHRFQTLSVYLASTKDTFKLVGTPFQSPPPPNPPYTSPKTLVYIHGGAWRAYDLTSHSIEPTAAHAFSSPTSKIKTVIAINYTLSPSAANAVVPIGYDPVKDNHSDPSREAVHPAHIADVLRVFALLRLEDKEFVLCGHSCGACISLQTVLRDPREWGLGHLPDPPCPAAVVVLNGLYDLMQLVHGLGGKHAHFREDYRTLISQAFRSDEREWEAASPARFDAEAMTARVQAGRVPPLVLLDHSEDDQLAPVNGSERMELQLHLVEGMKVVRGHRSKGKHAEIWEEGQGVWETIGDVLMLLESRVTAK